VTPMPTFPNPTDLVGMGLAATWPSTEPGEGRPRLSRQASNGPRGSRGRHALPSRGRAAPTSGSRSAAAASAASAWSEHRAVERPGPGQDGTAANVLLDGQIASRSLGGSPTAGSREPRAHDRAATVAPGATQSLGSRFVKSWPYATGPAPSSRSRMRVTRILSAFIATSSAAHASARLTSTSSPCTGSSTAA
jgi:hypothetical protein